MNNRAVSRNIIIKIVLIGFVFIITAIIALIFTQNRTYKFDSSIKIGNEKIKTTTAVLVNDEMSDADGCNIENTTGYDICVATDKTGFNIIGKGMTSLQGSPKCIFILKPEESMEPNDGEIVIESNNNVSQKYVIEGYNDKVKLATY